MGPVDLTSPACLQCPAVCLCSKPAAAVVCPCSQPGWIRFSGTFVFCCFQRVRKPGYGFDNPQKQQKPRAFSTSLTRACWSEQEICIGLSEFLTGFWSSPRATAHCRMWGKWIQVGWVDLGCLGLLQSGQRCSESSARGEPGSVQVHAQFQVMALEKEAHFVQKPCRSHWLNGWVCSMLSPRLQTKKKSNQGFGIPGNVAASFQASSSLAATH